MIDSEVILWGEIRCLSLSGVKGLGPLETNMIRKIVWLLFSAGTLTKRTIMLVSYILLSHLCKHSNAIKMILVNFYSGYT